MPTLPSTAFIFYTNIAELLRYLKNMQFARKLSEFDDTLTPSSYSKEKMDEWLDRAFFQLREVQ